MRTTRALMCVHVPAFCITLCSLQPDKPIRLYELLRAAAPLLPLIHGGKLSSASAQPICTVSMNIWTGRVHGFMCPVRAACWIQGHAAVIDGYVCFTEEGGGPAVIIRCLTQGGIRHGRVHRGASGLMDVYFMLGSGVKSLSDEVAELWLMGNFWGRERKKWGKIFAPQTVTHARRSCLRA